MPTDTIAKKNSLSLTLIDIEYEKEEPTILYKDMVVKEPWKARADYAEPPTYKQKMSYTLKLMEDKKMEQYDDIMKLYFIVL